MLGNLTLKTFQDFLNAVHNPVSPGGIRRSPQQPLGLAAAK
jgi:hypothetical protein